MDERFLVTVVIPAFNAVDTIVDCLDSVFCQGGPDVECLVIDDGSTDGTGEVVKEYANAHSKFAIRCVGQENAGVSVARNRGVEAANGRYVTFLDSDDMLDDAWLETVRESLEELAAFDVIVFSDTSEKGEVSALDCLRGCLSSRPRPGSMARSALCCPFAKVYASACLRERGLLFPPGIRTGEDMLFNASLFASGALVAAWPASIYVYRKRMGSVTNTGDPRYLQNELDYHRKLKAILAGSDIPKDEAREIELENCLGGILGVILHSANPREKMRDLLNSPAGSDYREALENIGKFSACFGSCQKAALRLASSGRVALSSTLLRAIALAKKAYYTAKGGVVLERI